MGIPGLLKEIGKGERLALTKLAIDHLERTNRPLRIAVDAAIWNFQNQASQGGKNPALRTLFFRLLKLLALPIHPVFVYDGKNKPRTKRGKTVSRYGTSLENEMAKELLSKFRFPFHTAPGEAEAECALLQQRGIVDAVMSQDVDAIMFGSATTYRDWSKEGTRGNKTPSHVNVLDLARIKSMSGLDPDGMILVALLSGGDYDEAGVSGFGSALACEIARAGFGSDLLDLVRNEDKHGIKEWKERLEYELQTNESGYFKRRHLKLQLPDDFPNKTILGYYTDPATSSETEMIALEWAWCKEWASEIDVASLREYTAVMLDWKWKSGARRFARCFAQPLFQDRLQRGTVQSAQFAASNFHEERRHFVSGGIVELRFSAVPASIVGIDIEAEEDNPDWLTEQQNERETEQDSQEEEPVESGVQSELSGIPKSRRLPWNPYKEEKWWIPQTLLKLGLGAATEDWEQLQRDILADSTKFITRKCPRTKKPARIVDKRMKQGAMVAYLNQVPELCTDVSGFNPAGNFSKDGETERSDEAPKTPLGSRSQKAPEEASPTIVQFFKPAKLHLTKCDNGGQLDHTHDQASLSSKLSEDYSVPHEGQASSEKQSYASVNAEAGASFSNSITIDSSPIHDQRSKADPINTHDQVPDNVTQRRGRNIVSSGSPVRKASRRKQRDMPRKIDSFFKDPTSLKALNSTTANKSSPVEAPDPRSAEPEHNEFAVLTSRTTAMSRESLPGTWKPLDMDMSSVKQKRAPRISHIDLTGD